MTIDGPTLTVITGGIAGIVWLVRLEGRVNGHDQEHRQTRADITYIRDRIDEAIDRERRGN